MNKTYFFEMGNPCQIIPGVHNSRLMCRIWWLWFAVGVIKMPLYDFTKKIERNETQWLYKGSPI